MKVRWREKKQNNSWKMSEIHFLRFVFWNPWHTLGISLYIPILHLTCERPGFECFENKTSNTLRAEPSKWVYQKSWEGWAFRRKRGFSSSWCCPGTVPTQLFRFFCPHCSLYFCLSNLFNNYFTISPWKCIFPTSKTIRIRTRILKLLKKVKRTSCWTAHETESSRVDSDKESLNWNHETNTKGSWLSRPWPKNPWSLS